MCPLSSYVKVTVILNKDSISNLNKVPCCLPFCKTHEITITLYNMYVYHTLYFYFIFRKCLNSLVFFFKIIDVQLLNKNNFSIVFGLSYGLYMNMLISHDLKVIRENDKTYISYSCLKGSNV